MKPIIYSFLILALGGIFSCNDPASIDTNLVDADLLDIEFDDNFDISSYSVTEDSVLAYTTGFTNLQQYPFGIYKDPIFGTTNASIAAQLYITTVDPPTFENAELDSVILELILSPFDPFYGDSTGVVGLEVYEIDEILDAGNDYYSSYRTQTKSSPIGTYEGIPNFRDSIEITRYQADTLFTDTFPAHISVKIDNSYGEEILAAGDDILSSATEFTSTFKGLELRPTIENAGLIAFNLNTFAGRITPNVNGARLNIYYKEDGNLRQFNLVVNTGSSVKYVQYQQDISGTMVEEFVDDEVKGDSLLFVQGMVGPNTIIRLNDVDRLDKSIINGATLEVYGSAFNNDEDIRPLPVQLVLRELDDIGELPYIRDFESASNAGNLSLSGGIPEDLGNGIFKYSFQIGSQLQDIIEGDAPTEIYIRTSPKISTMNRVVLFGANHSTYPIKLNVTYTKL